MPRWNKALLAVLAGVGLWAAADTPAERGHDLFTRRCSGCHALDTNKEGPRLRGVFGRPAAGLADFDYSAALTKTGIRWDERTLDRWLIDPDAVAPGADMPFRVPDGEERKALIAYLRSLTGR